MQNAFLVNVLPINTIKFIRLKSYGIMLNNHALTSFINWQEILSIGALSWNQNLSYLEEIKVFTDIKLRFENFWSWFSSQNKMEKVKSIINFQKLKNSVKHEKSLFLKKYGTGKIAYKIDFLKNLVYILAIFLISYKIGT